MTFKLDRKNYAKKYGPTTGDKIRLADTELFIEIEKDFAVYGDENLFGGGKTIRDGMGQSSTATRDQGVLDFVLVNAVIIDHWGIVKGDIGIKDGKIVGIGKAGNPDTQDGVSPNMIIGASTEVHGAQGLIVTSGWQVAMLAFFAITVVMLPAAFMAGRADKIEVVRATGPEQSVLQAIREATSHSGYVVMAIAFFVSLYSLR